MKTLRIATGLCVLGLACLTGCPQPSEEDFGTVRIELRPAPGQTDPYAGTNRITVSLDYLECLQSFYTQTNTEYAQDGVEGEPLFEEWKEILCSDSSSVPCNVTELGQNLNEQAGLFRIEVEYEVTSPDEVESRFLFVGPLPTETLADGCSTPPLVRLGGNSVNGFAGQSSLWGVDSFDNPTARTDQGAPIIVNAARN